VGDCHDLETLVWLPVVALALLAASGCEKSAPVVSYQGDVAPILDKHCKSCHLPGQAGYVVSGFELTGYESLMKGTQFGRWSCLAIRSRACW